MGAQVLFYFGRFNSLVLVVDYLRSELPFSSTKATLPRICAASVRASYGNYTAALSRMLLPQYVNTSNFSCFCGREVLGAMIHL